MTTKDWLNRGRSINKELAALDAEERQAMALATSIVAPPRDVVVRSTSGRKDENLIKYADGGYIDSIIKHKAELNAILHEISAAIYAVQDGTLRTLLINRYILFKSWEQTAVDMHCDIRNIQRMHNQALCAVDNVTRHVLK